LVVSRVRILGIETSCDETAAAVVDNGRLVRSSVVASQADLHARYGGVVPEIASRAHVELICDVIEQALVEAGSSFDEMDAVAAVRGPGLAGALLVGVSAAKAISIARGLPYVGVHHHEAHLYAAMIEDPELEPPLVTLIVSGGHTLLVAMDDHGSYRVLGETVDDAAGEAFDKVAKLLGFGYPGGPVIDMLAPYGDPKAVRFTLAKMKGNTLDFSFSGLKTAVLRWFEARDLSREVAARRELQSRHPTPSQEQWLSVTAQETLDVLASFQYTVIEELLNRAKRSAEEIDARSLIVSGGVACNSGLRLAAQCRHLPYPVFFPDPGLSTDNAAMIAAAAFVKLGRREFAGWALKADASLALA
jgi:N6-L-threonylcarbamoyladenine synthase